MYGLPANADLRFLLGKELQQVCVGQHEIILHFFPEASITIQSDFEVIPNARGAGDDKRLSDVIALVKLIGGKIKNVECAGPNTLVVGFSSNVKLLLHDNDPNYESFVISAPDQCIVV